MTRPDTNEGQRTPVRQYLVMELKLIFDVATKRFDWQPILVSGALLVGGCASVLSQRLWPDHARIKYIGHFLVAFAILIGGYMSIDRYVERQKNLKALEDGRFDVVEGRVENFQPMYYGGREVEKFTVSGQAFSYSDHKITTCFNQPMAHGGPIHADMLVRIEFDGDCILRVESLTKGSSLVRE